MSNCKFKRKLGAFHDGELPQADSREVQTHLDRCASCSHQLEEMNRFSKALESLASVQVPGSTLARLRDIPYRNGSRELLPMARLMTSVSFVLLFISLLLSPLFGGDEQGSSALSRVWEEMTLAREAEAEILVEPEAEMTRWVVAGLSGGNME